MAQEEQRTAYYAALCEQLYNPKSPQERDQVQKMLEYSFPTFADEAGTGIAGMQPPPGMENSPTFAISTPTDTASALRVLLENSPNPYVQTFCLSRLKQLITSQFSIFSHETKLQLRKRLSKPCILRVLLIILHDRRFSTWVCIHASWSSAIYHHTISWSLCVIDSSGLAGRRRISKYPGRYQPISASM